MPSESVFILFVASFCYCSSVVRFSFICLLCSICSAQLFNVDDGVVEPPPLLMQVQSARPPRLLQPQPEKVPPRQTKQCHLHHPVLHSWCLLPCRLKQQRHHLKGSGGSATRSSCYVDRRGMTSSSSLRCPAWLRRHRSRRLRHLAVIPHQQLRRLFCRLRR
jgi:hypothetical protein